MTETITYRTGTYGDESAPMHIWEINNATGSVIADLHVSLDTGEIANIEVNADRRGEGLARRLYEAAAAQMPILHAPVAHRTPEGHVFAEAVGGPTATYPCSCYGCTCTEED